MKSHLLFVPAYFLFIIFLTGCDDEEENGFSLEGTDVSVAEIAGSWTATKAFFGKSGEGPVMEVDVVAIGGSLDMQIQTDGKFSVTVALPGETPETSTGRLGFDEDLLVISFDEDPDEFEFFGITHNEPNLNIRGGIVYEAYDFDGDGNNEDADIDFELLRNP